MQTVLKNFTLVPSNEEQSKIKNNDDELLLSANKKVTIQCGKSSITLHPSGKIVIKGEYILSDAETMNRLVGGRVEIN